MRICIDARWMFSEASGITVYTRELIRRLAAADKDNEYILLFDSPLLCEQLMREIHRDRTENVSWRIVSYGVFSIRNQLLLPRLLRGLRIDVFHSTNYMVPLLAFPRLRSGRTKCVATIHDVIPMVIPEHSPKSKKSRLLPVYTRLMIEIGARADAIIAVSQRSRSDIVKHLRINADRADTVRVIYNGVSDCFHPALAEDEQGEATKVEADARTVLSVGRMNPYKNCVRLVEAFALACKRSSLPLRLTMVGPNDPRYPEARTKAEELGIADKVRWQYLSGAELVDAYRDADVFVFPSLYEGFGLPVLEAMACGTPVICSDRASLPEVAGQAAMFVDPDDSGAIAEAICRVAAEEELAKDLSEKGLAQARKFTWEATAAGVLDLYRELGAVR